MPAANVPAGVEATLRSLARELEREVDGLVETMLERMHDEVPDFDVLSRPELELGLRASCYGNVRAALGALGSDRVPPSSSPTEAAEEARVTARSGVTLEPLLHTYRVGHAVVWERLHELARASHAREQERDAALRIGSRYLFAYVDAVCSLVTEEYTRERERVMRTSIQRRVQLVRDVLAGASFPAAELGYDLDAEHLAAIAAGPGAEATLGTIAHQLDSSLLTVAVTGDTIWGWFGARHGLDKTAQRHLPGTPIPGDTHLALGEACSGANGFRTSHQQAQAAHRVGSRLNQPLTRYDDVALEAAILSDGRVARPFIERELGPLLEDTDRATRLRATLHAYLATGLNASSAAARLGVSDRAVAYRIRAIEGMLGRNVSSRSAELTAALRLQPLLAHPDRADDD